MQTAPVRTDLVLVGGGHAHLHVIADLARRPVPGLRVTLVARELETPYSGMLPGHIAGIYRREEVHIDLARLCAVTGTRLIHAAANGLDRPARRVMLQDRPPLAYDLLSIDVGIEPMLTQIEGAAEHGIAVKPIGLFLDKLDRLMADCRRRDGPRHIAVIGAGAGGVELILSLRTRIRDEARAAGLDPDRFAFTLLTGTPLLATHNSRVQAAFRHVLADKGVRLLEGRKAAALAADRILLADGNEVAADAILLATDAAAPAWFADTGLDLDGQGFLAVGPTLQSTGDPTVFAAGDCAGLTASPRPKAGVYAVRAGPPLARNLRRVALGKPPRPWHPQRDNLALISTGERHAIASRGPFKAEGAWLWRLKDRIDRRWMRMYQDAPAMARRMRPAPRPDRPATPEEMRCGGCAAKVGPGPLGAALARLPQMPAAESLVLGLDHPDDAAVTQPTPGMHSLHSVDFFRAFTDDPYLLGQVAASHALNDIYAMGGQARHALAIAVIPHGAQRVVEEDLFQMLSGARDFLDAEDVALAGGHSSEGTEMAIGFAVTGEVAPGQLLRKSGLLPGNALILTRPLGTAILLAGLMRGLTPAGAIAAAFAEMRRSNRRAASILAEAGATAMTDITGFGLAGHLGEMLAASEVSARIEPQALPLYPQVTELARQGVHSSLLAENLALRRLVRGTPDPALLAILFDPQTSGGMLAGLPPDAAEATVAALRDAGHAHARIIGEVTRAEASPAAAGIELA